MRKAGKLIKKSCILTMGAAVIGGLGACSSTSSVVKTSNAAPITYKVGQGAVKYASLRSPALRTNPSAPQHAIPVMPHQPHVQKFDQSEVDRDLYAHQRVGKKYKIAGKSYRPKHEPDYDETGIASWYGDKFHGKPTATGEIFNKNDLTAAHKTLPLNSMVFVTNLETGKTLMVRVNDRGPFIGKRIIDLSEASARALGITHAGLGKVRVQYAGPADPMAAERFVPPASRPQMTVDAPVVEATPTPAPSAQSYVPLRELPQATAPRAAENMPAPAPNPSYLTPTPLPTVPAAPDMDDEGVTTLTIKGPVHMASNSSNAPAPRFIPAVNYKKYNTKK